MLERKNLRIYSIHIETHDHPNYYDVIVAYDVLTDDGRPDGGHVIRSIMRMKDVVEFLSQLGDEHGTA